MNKAIALSADHPLLDPETTRAVRAFGERLPDRYVVRERILFGSRARGTNRADSDADLAIVLAGNPGDRYETVRELAGIAFDVMLGTGVLIQALPLWAHELERPEGTANPSLIRNILRDGLRL